MGDLNSATAPRDLSPHYKEVRGRLMGLPKPNQVQAPRRPEPDPLLMQELARLRLETKIFREYLTERGVDAAAVINRKPTVSTGSFNRISVKQVVAAVCDRFMIQTIDLHSMRRTQCLNIPRQTAFYLARNLTGRSLPEIGRMIGDRDHTTVLHGWRRISELMRVDPELAYDIAQLHIDLGIEGRQ